MSVSSTHGAPVAPAMPPPARGDDALRVRVTQCRAELAKKHMTLDPRAEAALRKAEALAGQSGTEDTATHAPGIEWLLEQAALHAEMGTFRHLWTTVPLGLGDWSIRVNYPQSPTRHLVQRLDELHGALERVGATSGAQSAEARDVRLRFKGLQVEAKLLAAERRFDRKRNGKVNEPANRILDGVPAARREIKLYPGRDDKGFRRPDACAGTAKSALESARTGFDALKSSLDEAALHAVEKSVDTADLNMTWYDKLRGELVERGVTWFAYIPSVLLLEPFMRKMGAKRWDRSKRWGDMMKVLGFKEILNMGLRFLLMGGDFSLTDLETVSGPVVELAVGAAITGAVTLGASYTHRKLIKSESPLVKACIDAFWGILAGYPGGYGTWAAIPENARGATLHECGMRSVREDIKRFGFGHLLISGFDYLFGSRQPAAAAA